MYRALLADDSPEFLEWLRSTLEGSRLIRVAGEAGSGAETLALVAELDPDLVIADVDMPNLDGFDVARRLRQDHPEVRVILISVHTGRSYARLARQEGALAFIPKVRLTLESLEQALQGGEAR